MGKDDARRRRSPHDRTVQQRMTTCPVRAVEQYIAVGAALGWNMTEGYLFPRSPDGQTREHPLGGKTSISAPDMTKALKVHARDAGEHTAFTMHSFRSGEELTRALAGEDLPTVMQRAFWKKPSTAWRYLRLMEVMIPGSVGNSMATGVSPEQHREINEFGLSEQSRHWAAFGNAPIVCPPTGKEVWGGVVSECNITRKGLISVPTTKLVFHKMGPLVTGRRKHWRGKASMTTNFIPYYLDKKYQREDTPVLCRGRFSRATTEAGEPSQRDALF